MADIQQLRERRFNLLHKLWEVTGGDEYRGVDMWELGNDLGFTREDVENVVQYLQGEGLLQHLALGVIGITHRGVVEIEDALQHPEGATTYFPPVNIINIHHMEGSQIQQGTSASSQIASFGIANSDELARFLQRLRGEIPNLSLEPDDHSELHAEISTVEAQIASPRPKRHIIRDSLHSIQRILESAAGTAIGAELVQLMPSLLSGLGN